MQSMSSAVTLALFSMLASLTVSLLHVVALAALQRGEFPTDSVTE